jgi:hypothetical protein
MADPYRESERKGVSSFKSAPEKELKQLVVTINPAIGGIVKVEKIDKAGRTWFWQSRSAQGREPPCVFATTGCGPH